MKIVWKVDPAPTGRYRSFERRAWPVASLDSADGPILAKISSEDEYVPKKVKTGEHAELVIRVADYRPNSENTAYYKWRTLKKRAATLKEAKELVFAFYSKYPNVLPQEKSED